MGDTPISNVPESSPESPDSAWHAIRSAFASEGAIDDEFAGIMDEIEAERRRDFDETTANS